MLFNNKSSNHDNGDKSLWRKLITVIVIKLCLILAIWWLFMKDNRVTIDDKATEHHILST